VCANWSRERMLLIWLTGHPDCLNANYRHDEMFASEDPATLPGNGAW
jgi:hypothetical protein